MSEPTPQDHERAWRISCKENEDCAHRGLYLFFDRADAEADVAELNSEDHPCGPHSVVGLIDSAALRATVEGCLEAVEEAKNDEADLNEYHDGQNRMCDYVASCIRERFDVWEKK